VVRNWRQGRAGALPGAVRPGAERLPSGGLPGLRLSDAHLPGRARCGHPGRRLLAPQAEGEAGCSDGRAGQPALHHSGAQGHQGAAGGAVPEGMVLGDQDMPVPSTASAEIAQRGVTHRF
jgi:hypothetical protein